MRPVPRKQLARMADGFAIAIAVSLPWSISETQRRSGDDGDDSRSEGCVLHNRSTRMPYFSGWIGRVSGALAASVLGYDHDTQCALKCRPTQRMF
jgi:hypothetical protein